MNQRKKRPDIPWILSGSAGWLEYRLLQEILLIPQISTHRAR
jgi:hypothetical protein